MYQENLSQEFRLRNIDETRNYFVKEIKQNELMSNKQKKKRFILLQTILNTLLF